VVGEEGVLVIDAHISIPMARQIQARVREVTDKPIRYLVNTNYHGDHTFGNCAFPATTLVIQHRATAERVPYMEEEKAFLLPCVGSKPETFAGVTLRLPDIVFDDSLRIDLGGQTVELHWFGPANTPGDTIAYVPSAKAAWTGNMTGGSFGLALESDAPTYLGTLTRFIQTIEVEKPATDDRPGFLSVRTTPWVKVHIDGTPLSSTPLFKEKVKPGKHALKLVNEELGIHVEKTITIVPGETLKKIWDCTHAGCTEKK
jgi:hypothetical protein